MDNNPPGKKPLWIEIADFAIDALLKWRAFKRTERRIKYASSKCSVDNDIDPALRIKYASSKCSVDNDIDPALKMKLAGMPAGRDAKNT